MSGFSMDVPPDERRVRELIDQLTAIEAELETLAGGVDAVLDDQAAPLLLRQAQLDLQQRTAELARAHATLQALFDNSLDAILLADNEGRYVNVNAAAAALVGCTREELLKMSIWEVSPAANQEMARSLWREFLAAGYQTTEYTLLRADGSTVEVEYRAVAHIRPGLHMAIMRDISQRKTAEAALKLQAQQLQALSHRLVQVQEAERRAVSRELHDETGQALTALKLGLGLLRRETANMPVQLAKDVQNHLDELRTMVDAVMDGIHQLAVNLRPVSLDRYGLAPAVEQYLGTLGKGSGIQTEFVVGDLPALRLPPEMETTLYRVVQEASTNVIRHAQATRLSVMLTARGQEINLLIEDNGVGFNVEEALTRGRLGLSGIRERVQMLGGTLNIESLPGRGTTLYVQVPLPGGTEPAERGATDQPAASQAQPVVDIRRAPSIEAAVPQSVSVLSMFAKDVQSVLEELQLPDTHLQQALAAAVDALSREAFQQQQQLALITAHIEEILILLAVEGDTYRCVYINPAGARANGIRPEEVIGRTIEEALPPEIAAFWDVRYDQVAASGEPLVVETTNQTLTHIQIYKARISPVLDDEGHCTHILVVAHDVTERRRMEQQLRDSQALYRALQDAIPAFVWSADSTGRADYVNQAWQEYTGLSLEELNEVGWEAINHPDDAPALQKAWQQAVEARCSFEARFRYRRHDGTYEWFIGRAVPLLSDSGEILRWVGISLSVEELKQINNRM